LRDRRAALMLGFGVALPAALAIGLARRSPRPGHPFLAGAPLQIAHRGGAGLAPENTLLALRRAVDWWRSDVVELDVQPSRDGEAVVVHDATVDRTTDGRGAVDALTVDRLRELDAGYRFTRDGVSYPFRGRGLTIPTFAEALDSLPDVRLIVEIKDGRVQERVWETIRERRAWHRVLVASSNHRHRARFARYPGPTSASTRQVRAFLAMHRLRLTGLFRSTVDALQVPERHDGRLVVDERFVQQAHALNLPVHVWTVNDPIEMRRFLGWGVDGIVTDRPDLLGRILHERIGRPLPPGPPPDADP
jgi:glycerophosphoryl diester phosphodiesterase